MKGLDNILSFLWSKYYDDKVVISDIGIFMNCDLELAEGLVEHVETMRGGTCRRIQNQVAMKTLKS